MSKINETEHYLEKSRRHICIVGKFWIPKPDEDKVIDLDFANAKKRFQFCLYSTEEKITLDNMTAKVPGFALPRDIDTNSGVKELKFPKVFDEYSVAARKKFGPGPDTYDKRAEYIGGRLLVDLLNALDDVMPFSHPNFDRLLTAAFVDYVNWKQERTRVRTRFTEEGLTDFVAHPVVNQRLVSFIRSAPADAETRKKFSETFRRAAREAEKQEGEFAFSPLDKQPDTGGESRLDILSGYLDDFQKWLRDDTVELYSPRTNLFTSSVQDWTLPSHSLPEEYAAGPVEYVRDLFRRFDDANCRIQELVVCEPLLSLMGYWALRRFGNSPNEMASAMGKRYFAIPNPNAKVSNFFSDTDANTLHRDVEKDIEDKTRRDADKPAQQAVADAFKRSVTQVVCDMIQWKNKYDAEDLFKLLNELYVQLMALLTEGLKESLKDAKALTEELCAAFMIYQREVRKDSTADNLKTKLEKALGKETYARLKEWLDNLCEQAAKQKWDGEVIAAHFQKGFRDHLTEKVGSLSNSFIEHQSEKIDDASKNAESAHASALEALKPNRDGVPETAPGASLGVVDLSRKIREAQGENLLVEYREGEASKRSLARTADVAKIIVEKLRTEEKASDKPKERQKESTGPGGTAQDPGWTQKVMSEFGQGPEFKEGEDFSSEQLKTLRNTLDDSEKIPNEQWNHDVGGPRPWECAKHHWDMQEGMSRLLEDINLVLDRNFAGERGIMRALLVGKYLYALPEGKSLLSLEDRSLVVQLVVRMVQYAGASPEWESDATQGSTGTRKMREELYQSGENLGVKAEQDLTTGSIKATGVGKMPWKDIFPIAPNSGRDGNRKLTACLDQCILTAERIVRVADELEEREGLMKLLEALSKSGKEGRVTIINETLEEHTKRASYKQRIVAVEPDIEPPGICYVTQQAAASSEPGTDLTPLLKSLFDDVDEGKLAQHHAPLGRRKHYRALGQRDVLFGMPIFVGPGLTQTKTDVHCRRLPVLTIEGSDTWEAVMYLAGLSSGAGSERFWDAPISESRQKVFHQRALGFRSKMADKIVARRSLGGAWCDVLIGDAALAEQFWSRVASWGLHARFESPGPAGANADNPDNVADVDMHKAVLSALEDLGKIHGSWYTGYPDERGEKGDYVFRRRFSIAGGNSSELQMIPDSTNTWNTLAPETVFVGTDPEKDKRISLDGLAELFKRI